MSQLVVRLARPLRHAVLEGDDLLSLRRGHRALDRTVPVRAGRAASPLEAETPPAQGPQVVAHETAFLDAAQRAQDQAAIERVLAAITQAAGRLQSQVPRCLAEVERAAVELATAIASRLVRQKVQAGDFAVEALVRQVVERLTDCATTDRASAIEVFLHPEDLALLERRLGAESGVFPARRSVRLVADSALVRGDCRAEVGDVSILAQLEVQLAELREHLFEQIGQCT